MFDRCGDLVQQLHGIIQTMCLCHRTEPSGAKGQEVCCKESRDTRGEAVHLCGVDWYRPGGAIHSAPDWIQELQVREEVRRAIALGLGTEVQGGVQEQRGSAGGGNQVRQPYLKDIVPKDHYKEFPQTEHIHFYGFYIGNFPDLKTEEIDSLCEVINAVE